MPIYEYACSKCGKITDVLQKMNDPAPEKCEHCGEPGTLTRVVSRTSFVLKGGGWYADLYGSSGSKDSAPKDSGSKDPKATAASTPATQESSSTSVSAPASTASSTTSTASKPATPAPSKPKSANE